MTAPLATYRSSSSDSVYSICQARDGSMYCDCNGWKFSKASPKTCSHLEDFHKLAKQGMGRIAAKPRASSPAAAPASDLLGRDKYSYPVRKGDWLFDNLTGFVMRAGSISTSEFLSDPEGWNIPKGRACVYVPVAGEPDARIAPCDLEAYRALTGAARRWLGMDMHGSAVHQGDWLRDVTTDFVMRAGAVLQNERGVDFRSSDDNQHIPAEHAFLYVPFLYAPNFDRVPDEDIAPCDLAAYREAERAAKTQTPSVATVGATAAPAATYAVICLGDKDESGYGGRYELATRRIFASENDAMGYAVGISGSRKPAVVRGHWDYVAEHGAEYSSQVYVRLDDYSPLRAVLCGALLPLGTTQRQRDAGSNAVPVVINDYNLRLPGMRFDYTDAAPKAYTPEAGNVFDSLDDWI